MTSFKAVCTPSYEKSAAQGAVAGANSS